MKKGITDLAKKQGRQITILGIGVGNARMPKHLCRVKQIWDMVPRYDGTDSALACVDITSKNIVALNIQDKVTAYFFEAVHPDQWQKKYDLVITTWFTAGNFYPDDFSFETYQSANERLDLSENKKFVTIFKNAYGLLQPGGEVVIGPATWIMKVPGWSRRNPIQKWG